MSSGYRGSLLDAEMPVQYFRFEICFSPRADDSVYLSVFWFRSYILYYRPFFVSEVRGLDFQFTCKEIPISLPSFL